MHFFLTWGNYKAFYVGFGIVCLFQVIFNIFCASALITIIHKCRALANVAQGNDYQWESSFLWAWWKWPHIIGMLAQLCKYTKTPLNQTLKWWILCLSKLYLTKAIFNKKIDAYWLPFLSYLISPFSLHCFLGSSIK